MEKKQIELTPELVETIKSVAKEMMDKEGLDPNNAKIRIINPDTMQEIPQEIVMNNLVPTENTSIAKNTPAVTFDNFNVYTIDGVTSVSPNTYNTFFNISNNILENLKTPESLQAKEIFMNTVGNITCAHLTTIADNFLATISNIYDVFIARLNQLFISEKGEVVFQLEPHYACFSVSSFERGLNSYLNAPTNGRNEIINNYISYFAVSYVNMVGASIYNDVRSQVSQLISTSSIPEEGVLNFFKELDSNFSLMMMDMTYEVSVFSHNLDIANNNIPSAENMHKLLND